MNSDIEIDEFCFPYECDFCSAPPVIVRTGNAFCVQCTKCGMTSPAAYSVSEVIEIWNKLHHNDSTDS